MTNFQKIIFFGGVTVNLGEGVVTIIPLHYTNIHDAHITEDTFLDFFKAVFSGHPNLLFSYLSYAMV